MISTHLSFVMKNTSKNSSICPHKKCRKVRHRNKEGIYVGYCNDHSCICKDCWAKPDRDAMCPYHFVKMICSVEGCTDLCAQAYDYSFQGEIPVYPLCYIHKCSVTQCNDIAVMYASQKGDYTCLHHQDTLCLMCFGYRVEGRDYCVNHLCSVCKGPLYRNGRVCVSCKCSVRSCKNPGTRFVIKWLTHPEHIHSFHSWLTAAMSLKRLAPFLDRHVRNGILFEAFKKVCCPSHFCVFCQDYHKDMYECSFYCEHCARPVNHNEVSCPKSTMSIKVYNDPALKKRVYDLIREIFPGDEHDGSITIKFKPSY